MAIKCPKCHADNPETSRFCGNCATVLTSVGQPASTETLESPVYALTKGGLIGGKYRIIDEIGRGGMGVVYKAEDTTLARSVAIKALPEIFSSDPERMARFEREAKLLAALNHPNIATIHGLEETEGKRFLVMELVEGETLAERISRGPLPMEEAMKICLQVAEGVEAAHDKGIVHRDLKPGNVKLTPDGKIKVLDFGLAKAYTQETTGIDFDKSPTITEKMTEPGVILGTAAYMSPEQAKGKLIDKRTDIWAFGCILYECLTGKRAFTGETVTETMAAILRGEPDWDLLPTNTPGNVQAVLHQCLQKDPRERLRDIGDARLEIEATATFPPEAETVPRRPSFAWLAGCSIVMLLAGIIIGRVLIWKYYHPPLPSSSLTISGRPLASYPFYPIEVSKEGYLYIDKAKFIDAVNTLRQDHDTKAVADLVYLERKENITLQLGESNRILFQALLKEVPVPDSTRQEAYVDRLFDVYRQIVNGIGQSFAGTPIEIVLHDVRDPMHSIQALQNPISGRQLGQPTTNFGVELIKWYAVHPQQGSSFISYDLKLADGTPIKSSTIPLYDTEYGLIGFVCMNIRISDISETNLDEKTRQFLSAFRRTLSSSEIAEIVDNAKRNLSSKSIKK